MYSNFLIHRRRFGGGFMKARYHAMVSIVLALPFIYTGRFYTGLMCFLFGVFMDVDHEVDFFVEYRRFTLSAFDLSEGLQERSLCIIPLHSIEFVILLGILSRIYPCLIGGVIGVSVHLFFDGAINRMKPFSPFFVYRAINNFRRDATF